MGSSVGSVFTIGHSTHPTAEFMRLLHANGITALADLRSQPYSRMNPQFNKEHLRADLKTSGIEYVFLGIELGGRTTDRLCYANGRVQYELLAEKDSFRKGLLRIAEGMTGHRVVLMCAEKDPLTCHRAILVCRHLASMGIDAQHILSDGRLEAHDDALARLLTELGLGQPEMFRSREELIAQAYYQRGQMIAYRDTPHEKWPVANGDGQ